MKIKAQANIEQLKQVDVTMQITMRLDQWKITIASLRQAQYNWTKDELVAGIDKVLIRMVEAIEEEIKIES